MKRTCTLCGNGYTEKKVQDESICPECRKNYDPFAIIEKEIERDLKHLIKRFNEDEEYRRRIMQRANSNILKGHDLLDSPAEKRLIEMVVMSRY